MQIELLRRHRSGERGELVERGIHLTINAIATVSGATEPTS